MPEMSQNQLPVGSGGPRGPLRRANGAAPAIASVWPPGAPGTQHSAASNLAHARIQASTRYLAVANVCWCKCRKILCATSKKNAAPAAARGAAHEPMLRELRAPLAIPGCGPEPQATAPESPRLGVAATREFHLDRAWPALDKFRRMHPEHSSGPLRCASNEAATGVHARSLCAEHTDTQRRPTSRSRATYPRSRARRSARMMLSARARLGVPRPAVADSVGGEPLDAAPPHHAVQEAPAGLCCRTTCPIVP